MTRGSPSAGKVHATPPASRRRTHRAPAEGLPRRLPACAGASDLIELRRCGLDSAHEGPWTVINGRPGDDSATTDQLAVRFGPPTDAITDTVRWLFEAGHISARQAGQAGGR
jgi:hypothetical protein